MAVAALSIPAPCTLPNVANDDRPRKKIDYWPAVIARLHHYPFGLDWVACAWRAKAKGQTPLAFCEEAVVALREAE